MHLLCNWSNASKREKKKHQTRILLTFQYWLGHACFICELTEDNGSEADHLLAMEFDRVQSSMGKNNGCTRQLQVTAPGKLYPCWANCTTRWDIRVLNTVFCCVFTRGVNKSCARKFFVLGSTRFSSWSLILCSKKYSTQNS